MFDRKDLAPRRAPRVPPRAGREHVPGRRRGKEGFRRVEGLALEPPASRLTLASTLNVYMWTARNPAPRIEQSMKLTPEQTEAALEALNRVWRQPKRCEICHHTEWTIPPTLFELREFHGGDINLAASELIPLVPLVCVTCGHTILFNAIKLGVVLREASRPNIPEVNPYSGTGGRRR